MIDIELNLPTHVDELKKAEDYILELKQKFIDYKVSEKINVRQFTKLNTSIINTLYYVGGLSEPAFAAEATIESTYFNVHENQPELARKLWQDHYAIVHQPYNKLKNRLYRMLDELDQFYFRCNQRFPPDHI
jgi:hypothetical protein